MANNLESRPHIISAYQGVSARRAKSGGRKKTTIVERTDPFAHASKLIAEFDLAIANLSKLLNAKEITTLSDGVVVELHLLPSAMDCFDSLGLESFQCEVLQVIDEDALLRVLVFIPRTSIESFRARFMKYVGQKRTKTDKRYHAPLVDSLEAIGLATIKSYCGLSP